MESLPANVLALVWPSDAVVRGIRVSKAIRAALCSSPLRVVARTAKERSQPSIGTAVRETMELCATSKWTMSLVVRITGITVSTGCERQYLHQVVGALGPPVVALSFANESRFLDDEFIRKAVAAAPNVERVHVTAPQLRQWLGGLGSLEHLTELCLTNPSFKGHTIGPFFDALAAAHATPRLTVLEIVARGYNCLSLPTNACAPLRLLLAAASALRTLDTSALAVERDEFNSVYAPLTAHTQLAALGVSLKDKFGAPDLAVLAGLRPLRSLALHGADDMHHAALAALAALPALESLALCAGGGCSYRPTFPGANGAALGGLTRLTALHMRCQFEEAQLDKWGRGFLGVVRNPRLALHMHPLTPAAQLAPFHAAAEEGGLRAVRCGGACPCDW